MRRDGFTLIELLVVIAIIAILAAILFLPRERARCLANSLPEQSQAGRHRDAYVQPDYDEEERSCRVGRRPHGICGWFAPALCEEHPDLRVPQLPERRVVPGGVRQRRWALPRWLRHQLGRKRLKLPSSSSLPRRFACDSPCVVSQQAPSWPMDPGMRATG